MPPEPGGRRDVLLIGAAVALATAGCDGPAEHGHPLHARPRGVTDEAASFATVLDLEGLGRGVLVRTRAGHAVKLEGNRQHPASLGATDIFAASMPICCALKMAGESSRRSAAHRRAARSRRKAAISPESRARSAAPTVSASSDAASRPTKKEAKLAVM